MCQHSKQISCCVVKGVYLFGVIVSLITFALCREYALLLPHQSARCSSNKRAKCENLLESAFNSTNGVGAESSMQNEYKYSLFASGLHQLSN